MLSANEKNPPEDPSAKDLARWDKIGDWGNRGATLADPPDEDGKMAGLHGLLGADYEGVMGTLLLKPGFIVDAINFPVVPKKDAPEIPDGEAVIKKALGK